MKSKDYVPSGTPQMGRNIHTGEMEPITPVEYSYPAGYELSGVAKEMAEMDASVALRLSAKATSQYVNGYKHSDEVIKGIKKSADALAENRYKRRLMAKVQLSLSKFTKAVNRLVPSITGLAPVMFDHNEGYIHNAPLVGYEKMAAAEIAIAIDKSVELLKVSCNKQEILDSLRTLKAHKVLFLGKSVLSTLCRNDIRIRNIKARLGIKRLNNKSNLRMLARAIRDINEVLQERGDAYNEVYSKVDSRGFEVPFKFARFTPEVKPTGDDSPEVLIENEQVSGVQHGNGIDEYTHLDHAKNAYLTRSQSDYLTSTITGDRATSKNEYLVFRDTKMFIRNVDYGWCENYLDMCLWTAVEHELNALVKRGINLFNDFTLDKLGFGKNKPEHKVGKGKKWQEVVNLATAVPYMVNLIDERVHTLNERHRKAVNELEKDYMTHLNPEGDYTDGESSFLDEFSEMSIRLSEAIDELELKRTALENFRENFFGSPRIFALLQEAASRSSIEWEPQFLRIKMKDSHLQLLQKGEGLYEAASYTLQELEKLELLLPVKGSTKVLGKKLNFTHRAFGEYKWVEASLSLPTKHTKEQFLAMQSFVESKVQPLVKRLRVEMAATGEIEYEEDDFLVLAKAEEDLAKDNDLDWD